MENLQQKRPFLWVIIIALFLALFAFFMLGVRPMSDKIATQEKEINQLQQEHDLMQVKVLQIQASNENDDSQEEIEKQLPVFDNSEQVIRDLNMIGKKTKTDLVDVEFKLSETNKINELMGTENPIYEGVREVKMTASLEGTYKGIYTWFDEIEKLPRVMTVNAYDFEKPFESDTKGSQISANVTFTAYFYPPSEAVAE